jgi:acetolactate synthase small subunit
LQYLANGTQSMENGGVVVVEATQFNYSLSQISRIFESENVNILSILVHANPSDNLLQLTIKTNKQDLRAVVATLERLNYVVIENYSEHNDNEDLKSNFEGLMNYLKV